MTLAERLACPCCFARQRAYGEPTCDACAVECHSWRTDRSLAPGWYSHGARVGRPTMPEGVHRAMHGMSPFTRRALAGQLPGKRLSRS